MIRQWIRQITDRMRNNLGRLSDLMYCSMFTWTLKAHCYKPYWRLSHLSKAYFKFFIRFQILFTLILFTCELESLKNRMLKNSTKHYYELMFCIFRSDFYFWMCLTAFFFHIPCFAFKLWRILCNKVHIFFFIL